jgi:hypothetical protein
LWETKNFTKASFKPFLKLEIGIAFNHYQFVECTNVLSLGRHLSGLKIFQAILKSLSTGAEEAGIARNLLVMDDSIG